MKIYWKVTMQISATEFKDITVPADSIKDAWAIAMSEVNGVVIAINLLANQQDKIQSLLKPALAAPEPDDKPTKRTQRAALALIQTNGLDPRNNKDEYGTWLVGTKELAELFDALHLPERHTLYTQD